MIKNLINDLLGILYLPYQQCVNSKKKVIIAEEVIFLKSKGIREILAANFKANRRKLEMTQEELAEKAGVSTHYIAMIETCRKYPKPDMLEQIAKTLKIEPYKLFSVESDPNEPLERLYQKIIIDMKQIIDEAVEKVIQCKCKK